MGSRTQLGLWIALVALLSQTSCCRSSGTKCLYDKPCGGVVGVAWTPKEEWSYGLTIEPRGPYAANTKAFAITMPGLEDRLIVYGDGKGYVRAPWDFSAPIKVKEILTDSGAKWPDYVFAPGYKLRNPYELEAFIRQHRHLPGLPSQEIVVREGFGLVSTQKALVEKVEELSLYVIALQKQVDSLKALIAAQKPSSPLR